MLIRELTSYDSRIMNSEHYEAWLESCYSSDVVFGFLKFPVIWDNIKMRSGFLAPNFLGVLNYIVLDNNATYTSTMMQLFSKDRQTICDYIRKHNSDFSFEKLKIITFNENNLSQAHNVIFNEDLDDFLKIRQREKESLVQKVFKGESVTVLNNLKYDYCKFYNISTDLADLAFLSKVSCTIGVLR
jgi:hypothetical protein